MINFVVSINNKNDDKMKDNNPNLQFKTNINCSGCIAKVTPFLNDAKGIRSWEVDTANKDKVLTIKSDGITTREVLEAVQKAGFKIDPLNS